jgi:deazaflavin-dependent oxidoreductase (nitroreductase family)
MRVEHDGVYAAVASIGGGPRHPQWYHNLRADPRVELMDGTESWPTVAREIEGAEYDEWWRRCVEAFPPYAEYVVSAEAAGRRIPVFVLERA